MPPSDVANPELYLEEFTSKEDPALDKNERRIRSYASPIWYPDETTGELKRIDISLSSATVDGKNTFSSEKNTIKYQINSDGVSTFERGSCVLTAGLFQVVIEDEKTGEQRRADTASKPSALTRDDAGVIKTSGLVEYLEQQTKVLNGAIKEDIIIKAVPDKGLSDTEYVLFVFKWYDTGGQNLSLSVVDGELIWAKDSGATAFRAKRPYVYDAELNEIKSSYIIKGDDYAIGIRAADLMHASYPVTIDPTYTTEPGDALYSSSTKNSAGLIYEGNYQQFRLPGLHGVSSITGAVAGFYCGTADADMTFSVYCDVVGAWDESSAYTVLEALSFGSATATDQLANTVDSYEEYDILGSSGTNGIAKAYASTDTPNNVTVKLFRDGSVTQAYKENFFLLGTYDSNYVTFQDRGDANPPYIEITYTGYDFAVNDNVADAGFHVLYNRSVGDNDWEGEGDYAFSSTYALLDNPPDLTDKTIEEAWLQVYVNYASGDGLSPVSIYINDTNDAPWNESSGYSTLNGLTMGTASSTTYTTFTSAGYKWADVTDVVTAAYAGDSSPETLTIKLKQTEFAITDNSQSTTFDLGDVATYSEDTAAISPRTAVTHVKLYIWYSDDEPPASTRSGGSGSAGIVLGKLLK